MTANCDLGTRFLQLERDGPIAWCTIARADAANALTNGMYRGIGRAVRLVEDDPTLQVLIITGTDRVFATGGDMGGHDPETPPNASPKDGIPFGVLRNTPIIVIAAINGTCQASGVIFSLLADVSIASERATFRMPELRRGVPDMWYAALLPHHIGMGRAKELVLTGRRVDAREALAIGLVSTVVEHDALRREAEAAAIAILEAAPMARAAWKRAAHATYGVVDESTMEAFYGAAEAAEGFAAFLERRKPAWSANAGTATTKEGR